MSQTSISFTVGNSDPTVDLKLQVFLDSELLYSTDAVPASEKITCIFDEKDSAEHQLKFVLDGKLPEHTKIDQDNRIVNDVVVSIDDLAFDEILLGHNILKLCRYSHDYNGTGTATVDGFFGTMGCNGTVTLNFTTPMYLWLLENM